MQMHQTTAVFLLRLVGVLRAIDCSVDSDYGSAVIFQAVAGPASVDLGLSPAVNLSRCSRGGLEGLTTAKGRALVEGSCVVGGGLDSFGPVGA